MYLTAISITVESGYNEPGVMRSQASCEAVSCALEFLHKKPGLLEEYGPDCIYNADETGLLLSITDYFR